MFPHRAFRLYPLTTRRAPHISLVFREMWDTTDLPFKPVARSQIHRGAPGSHQCTWAENDGRSPTTAVWLRPAQNPPNVKRLLAG